MKIYTSVYAFSSLLIVSCMLKIVEDLGYQSCRRRYWFETSPPAHTYIHTYVGLLQHRGYIQEAIVYTCPMKVVQYQ